MRFPTVSVIVSTYNRPDMLKEALQSIAAQTYRDFECWVIDDGSDTALPVCEELAPLFEDTGLVCVPLKTNSGYQALPKNHGIQLCNGTYIAYLDDDNLWDEDHLATLVEEIEKGEAELVYSLPRYYGWISPTEFDDNRVPEFVPASQQSLLGMQQDPKLGFIDTSGVLHSKAAFRAMFGGGVWNEQVRRFGDWELMCRAVNAGLRFRGVPKATFTYRWHDTNLQKTRPMIEHTAFTIKSRPDQLQWRGEIEQ